VARPLRVQFEGAFYHITSRGNRRERIFIDDGDRERFIECLRRTRQRFGIVIHAFVLMDNHYHLLIETPLANISKSLHHLNCAYSQHFNRRHQCIGHVLQGRFKAIIVDRDEYYLELIRYIHLNPVRAGIVSSVDLYRWSSHRAIIDARHAKIWQDIFDPKLILSHFGRRKSEALHEYKRFINAGIGLGGDDVFKGLSLGYILGSSGFVDWVRQNFIDADKLDSEVKGAPEFRKGFDTNEVLSLMETIYSVRRKDILSVRRGPEARNEARLLAIYLLARHSSMTQREIGKLFGGVGGAAINIATKVCDAELKHNRQLSHRYEETLKILGIS
jgi:REP element-mobilizing transposase RayT